MVCMSKTQANSADAQKFRGNVGFIEGRDHLNPKFQGAVNA